VEFVGAFWNMTLLPNPWRHASGKSSSWREKNPRTTSYICKSSSPLAASQLSAGRSIEEGRPEQLKNHRRGKNQHQKLHNTFLTSPLRPRSGPSGLDRSTTSPDRTPCKPYDCNGGAPPSSCCGPTGGPQAPAKSNCAALCPPPPPHLPPKSD
jgi:hypothetical protein